jgi:hypothetical protein
LAIEEQNPGRGKALTVTNPLSLLLLLLLLLLLDFFSSLDGSYESTVWVLAQTNSWMKE